jgi:sugar lactone lactonase YvrE
MSFFLVSFVSALIILQQPTYTSAQSCASGSYSYGSTSCSTCSAESTFITTTLGCRPTSAISNGPTDTSFYLSGKEVEGVAAFSTVANSGGITYHSSTSTVPTSALSLSGTSYLSTQALSTLPSGSSPFTVAAWIKCDASTITSSKPSSVAVAWGSPEVSTSATFSAATLSVSSVERGPSVYWVSTLAGTGGSGSNDGTGTAASFQYIRSIVSTKSGMVQYALENTGNRIRKITNPGGIVTTIPVTGLQNCYGASLDTTEQYLWLTELSRSRILRLDLSTNTLETKAGWNYWSFIDNADGTNAGFTYPYDLTIGGDGNVYVADMYAQRIRKIAVSNNFRVTTFAGSGSSGFSDGIGQTARFRNPRGICSDGTSLYVLDSSSHTVRKITISSQEVTTLAGMPGSWGYTDNFGTNARFYSPTSITYGNGFVYVGDINNGYRIRRVDVSTRQVTTFAGSGSYGNANGIATSASFNYFEDLSADEKGNVYVADGNNYLVRKISKVPGLPGGLPVCDSNWHHIALTYTGGASTAKTLTAYIDGTQVATTSATFAITASSSSSSSLRVGWNGNTNGELFAGNIGDIRIYNRSLTAAQVGFLAIPPLPSFPNVISPTPIPGLSKYSWFCENGAYGLTKSVEKLSDGGWSLLTSSITCTTCPANSYSFDGFTSCIPCPSGTVASKAGCVPSSSLSFGVPLSPLSNPVVSQNLSFVLSGSIVEGISMFNPTINNNSNVVAVNTSLLAYVNSSFGVVNGALSISKLTSFSMTPPLGPGLKGFSTGAASPITISARIKCPNTTVVLPRGAHVASWGGTKFTSSVQLSVDIVDTAFVTALVSTVYGGASTSGSSTDGVGTNAKFNTPMGLSMLKDGTMFVSDYGGGKIRKISTSGEVTTVIGSGNTGTVSENVAPLQAGLYYPGSVAAAESGNVYITHNSRIQVYNASRDTVYTLVGNGNGWSLQEGCGTAATVNYWLQGSMHLDSDEKFLFWADYYSHRIRRVDLSTRCTATVVGSNCDWSSYNSDNGVSGTNAKLCYPRGVTGDTAGNLYIVDSNKYRVVKWIKATNTINVIAGSGSSSYPGSDGIGTSATFPSLNGGIAVDSNGNVFVGVYYAIKKIAAINNQVTTIAGTVENYGFQDGVGTSALLSWTYGIVVNRAGNTLHITSDNRHAIRKLSKGMPLPGALPVCDGKWHSTVITSTGSTLTAYIDGALVGYSPSPTAFPSEISGLNKLRIGGDAEFIKENLFSPFEGELQDLFIYSRSLTAAEVLRLSQPPLPTYLFALNPEPAVETSLYTYSCIGGYAGPITTWTQRSSDNQWSYAGGQVSCSICPTGSYSFPSSVTCTLCAAGSFGSFPGISSDACSGQCSEGFYCPAGSIRATQNQCGGVQVICPTGTGAPTTVPFGFYSGPLNYPVTQRIMSIPCPSNNRLCSGGILYPAIDVAATCPAGTLYTTLADDVLDRAFGPKVVAQTPGWSNPNVAWNIINMTAYDPIKCKIGNLSLSSYTSNITSLYIGSPVINSINCSAGITISVRANRTGFNAANNSLYSFGSVAAPIDTCDIMIVPSTILRPPVVTYCAESFNVVERQPVPTKFGTIASADAGSLSTTLAFSFFSFVPSTPGATLPFALDCNGTLMSAQAVLYTLSSSYQVRIRIDNIGFGQLQSSYCDSVIKIIPKPVPPTLTNTVLSLFDLVGGGTDAGNLGPINNNNVAVGNNYTTSCRFNSTDAESDDFVISNDCSLTVKSGKFLDSFIKGTYTYTVNASDAISWAIYPITITLLQSARPATVFAQTRFVNDTAGQNTVISPRLTATHVQNKAFTFSLVDPSNIFNIYPNGTLYIRSTANAFDFNARSAYVLEYTVTDSSGLRASSFVTISLIESNKPPLFSDEVIIRVVNEGSVAGDVAGAPVKASDLNLAQFIAHSITSCSPMMWSPSRSAFICPFSIESSTGQLTVSALIPGGELAADRNATYIGNQFCYILQLRAIDNGAPILTATTQVNMTVVNIAPRLTSATSSIAGNAAAGTTALSVGLSVWKPYPGNTLTYTLPAQVQTAEGVSAFTINSDTGVISVATPTPDWRYNTKRIFNFNVLVTDVNTTRSSTTSFSILLTHVNRAPIVSDVPNTFQVPAGSIGNVVGVSTYYTDDDLTLSPPISGEALTYTLSSGSPFGNPSNTFSINNATGQIFVNNVTAFRSAYNLVTGGLNYSLAVTACDKGIDGPVYCSSVTVNITAITGSIAPVIFSMDAASIPENALVGKNITKVSAFDEAGFELSYAILSGNIDGAFVVNATTGWITVAEGAILNYATRKIYTLVISVSNIFALSTVSAVINIIEVNKAPSLPDVQSFTVAENSNAGTVICTAVGTDPNSADAGKLTYTIVSVSPTHPFTIFTLNRLTGVLTVAPDALLDFEATPTYTVTVRVTDSAWDTVNVLGPLSDDGNFVISLENMNDAPTINDKRVSVRENEAGAAVGTAIGALDQDIAQGLIFSLTQTNMVCLSQVIDSALVNAPVFLPMSLPLSALSNVYKVYSRIQKLAKGSHATLLIGSSASSDRYEIRLNNSGTLIYRCSSPTLCTLLASSSMVSVRSSSPSTSIPITNAEIELDPVNKRVKVTIYADGSYTLQLASMTAQDTLSMPTGSPLNVGVASTSVNTRFTGICFTDASQAASNTFSIDSSSGLISTTTALNYEVQQRYGVEVSVQDFSTSSTAILPPGQFTEYATVTIFVIDVNEAPYWTSGSLVACPFFNTGNSYSSSIGQFPSTSLYSACVYVTETALAGAISGAFISSASDYDTLWLSSNGANQSMRYSFDSTPSNVYRAPDQYIFGVNAISRQISLLVNGKLTFDFETQNMINLTAIATDFSTLPADFNQNLKLSASSPVAIYIQDVNEAPLISPQTCTVQEQTVFNNAPPGTLVSCNGVAGGAVVASDPDTPGSTWATLSYSLSGGNSAGLFTINPSTGVISVTSAVTCCTGLSKSDSTLSYESKNSYVLTVTVTDSGSLATSTNITINLIDVNEPPVLLPSFVRNVTENFVGPQVVGIPLAAYDPDFKQRLSFTIVGGNGSSIFDIDPCSGQVSILNGLSIDYEATQSFMITITVTDNGIAPITAALSDTRNYTIIIIDANDAPVFVVSSLSVTLPENSLAGATVSALVTVTDQDTFGGVVSWFNQTYEILNGNTDGIFDVYTTYLTSTSTQPNGAVMFVKFGNPQLLNFEDPSQNKFQLLLSARDSGGKSAQGVVTITLTDVNEAPFFSLSETLVRSIDETCSSSCATRAAGLSVGSSPLSASDPDVYWTPTQSLTFSIVSGGSSLFTIVPSTGHLQLTASGALTTSLDFEVTPSYVLLVRVQDSLGLFAFANVTVLINNRNEPPVFNNVFGPQPGTSLTSFSRSLPENSAIGFNLGAPLLITDPEEAIGAGLLVDISAGNSLNVFSINSTGHLLVSNTLNLVYETTQSFTLTVRVRDSGKPETAQAALEKTTSVNIAVLPINFPPTITGDTFTIAENSASGSNVMKGASAGSAVTTSADRNTLTPAFYLGANPYSILSQEGTVASRTGSGGQSPFTINTATGVISVNGAVNLDFETKSSYKVVVQVIDNGGLKANATFTIMLTNVNEAPFWLTVPTLNAIQIDPQTLSPALGHFAQDQDFNGTGNTEQLTYSIDSGNSQLIFAIDSNTGQLSVIRTSALFYPATPPVTLVIRVTDRGVSGAALSATTSVTITISDNNHPPVFGQSSYTFNINENQDYSALISPAILASDQESPTGEKVIYTISPSGNNINRPFPFAIATVAGGTDNVGQGQLSVKWDGTALSKLFNLDFEAPSKTGVYAAGFKTFTMTVTATDTHVPPASSIASVTINLIDIQEAPYFNSATRVANSGFYRFSIPEHTPISNAVNTKATIDVVRSINSGNQTLGGVLATDDDAADIGKLLYSLSSTTIFAINSITGVISGGSGATVLDFETTKTYSLNVIVTDGALNTDTATLVINVTDVNEVATWDGTGIYDRGGAAVNSLTLIENATVGTILGSVRAIDPDIPTSAGCIGCSQRIYSLVANAESIPFAVNPTTGVLTLIDPALIDWEDKALWQPTVAVTDSSASPLQATIVVNVNIIDVNDVSIFSLSIASQSSSLDLGETISPVPSAGGVAVLMRAAGGAVLVITGTNFGLTSTRKAAEPTVVTNVVATFGIASSNYNTYITTNCAVSMSNTEIRCTIPIGVGAGYTLKLTLTTSSIGAVSPATTLSSVLLSYYRPSISSIYLSTASSSTDAVTNTMSTIGGAQIIVDGRDLGPIDTPLSLSYSPSTASVTRLFSGRSCLIASADSKVQCFSSVGSGGSLNFKITVGGQVSSNFNNTIVRYASPTVTSALPLLLNTNATDNITLTGTNFGPIYADTADIKITYSNDWLSSYPHIYTASGCVVRVPHTSIFCRNAGEGVGVGLSFIATVSGQPSLAGATIDYRAPSITDLVSPKVFITPGGETIYINGYNFGPATLRDDLDVPLAGALFPTSRYGKTKTSTGVAISPSALSFSGVNCFVLVKHTMIQCTTNEGTGKDLAWSVTIGAQTSEASKQLTAYAPPIVAIYGGRGNDYFAPGAHLADTVGGEPVYITGSNFGPIGSPIDSVTYGVDGNDFIAANCGFSIAHTQLLCNTTVGAGSGLKWLVTIDGQISTVPSTDYAPPVITSVSGPGSVNASTDGGDIVILTGSYFSINKFLEKVTYGPKGTEFTARNCTVSRAHSEITCTTAPGTGRVLYWTVTIRGQSSSLSSTFTSYAAPTISLVQDSFGPTQGGKQIHIEGKNFGLAYAQSKISAVIDSAGYSASVPSEDEFNAHWASIYNGDTGLPSVASWITNSAVSVTTILPVYVSRTSASVDFILPEGYGSPINVFVLVDGVPSNRLIFGYDSPQIFNLAPDRLNISGAFLNLVIEGVNFCRGAQPATASNPSRSGCGRLFVDNIEVVYPDLRTWKHSRITAKVIDPNANVPGSSAAVRVEVAGRASNVATFSTPVPAFDAITGQQNWGGGSSTVVETATITFDLSLKGPGVTTAVVSQPKVAGPLRSSIGKSAGVSTSNVELTSLTDLSTDITTLLGPSDPANTVPGTRRRRLLGESGVNISFSLDVAASVQAAGGSLNPASIASMMANVSAALTSSSLLTSVVNAVAAAAGLNASLLSVYVEASSITNDVATVTKAPGSANPTRGGQYFYVAGVMSIHSVPSSQISITIGGRLCTQLNKTKDGDLSVQYGVSPNSPIASQYYTYKLECFTPAGVGKDLPIIISTGPGQNSQDNPNFRFSYAPPTITGIIDAPNNVPDNTVSYTASGTVNGIPTLGRRVRILGSNFGRPELLFAPAGTAAYSSLWDLQVTLSNDQAGFLKTATPISAFFDHEFIDVDIPTGQGANIIVSLSIGTQSDTDPLGGVSRAFTVIRYLSPSITQVITRTGTVFGPFASSGAPTIGFTIDAPYFLQIDGSNFGTGSASSGLEAGKPVVTVGGVDCPLVSNYAPNNGHSQIFCQVPEYWGKDLPVIVKVSEQLSAANVKYTYAPATISSISPSSGPTSGLRLSGASINVTIIGTNLGREGFVQFRPESGPYSKDPFAANITVPHSAMFVHNHTHMIFAMPEGAGYDLRVVASIGGQESITMDKTFTYDPPSIILIKSPTRSVADCSPRVALMRIGTGNKTMVVNRTIYPSYPGCYPTLNDPAYLVELNGESFGAPFIQVSVKIGGKACTVTSHTHTQAWCYAPSGMGDKNNVFITVGGRSNALTAASNYAYDPPTVGSIMPNRADAGVGQAIEIHGHNFGPIENPVTIVVGGKPCLTRTSDEDGLELPPLPARWISDDFLKCSTVPDVVGPKNLTILAANRSEPIVWLEIENFIELRCTKGFYGLRDEVCLECGNEPGQQPGAKCPGGELDDDLAVSLPGWYRFNTTETAQCDPLRAHRALPGGPGCPVFVACEPLESCLGANRCAVQYSNCPWVYQDANNNYKCMEPVSSIPDYGRCAYCANRFYRVNGECIKCPDSPWATVVVFLVIALLAMFTAHQLNNKNINLALISIGTDWAQVVAMFARTRIAWPQLVKDLFLLLSAFNFNLELIAPECAIPNVTYAGKWLFVEGMPLFAWSVLIMVFLWRSFVKVCILRVEKKKRYNHAHVVVATGVVVQRVLYLYMTRSTLDVFNCSPTDPPDYDKDGKMILYMAWNLSIKCNEPGGTHLWLLPFAIVALAIYVVGMPVLSLWWLWKNKETIKYDQLLRAQIAGDDKATNPHYAFRRTYKALYMNYRPGSWFWEFIICIRKFLIAFCSLMFRATPSFQLAMALLVIFIAYVLQVRSLPYLSHAKAVEAYREHNLKVLEGNSIHIRIDNEMKARAAYYARGMSGGKAASLNEVEIKKNQKVFVTSGGVSESPLENFYASRRSTFENQLREGRATILRNKVASFIFDYNTAEAVLLASCLLINLAGICFDSSRFSATVINMPGRKAEYDSLAFAVICVIFISLIFWIVSLSTDIALVLSPQAVNSCLGGLGKARKGLIAQAQKSIKGSKSSGSNGKRNSAKQSTVNSDVDPNEVQFEQNVDLLKRNLRGGIEDDGMSKTDLRRLVIDLQARLEDAESKSGPRTAKLANMKRAFDPVHVEDMNETRNVAQQPQIVPKENPMKQMFKLSDLKKADGDAPKQQSNQRTEAGGRLKGKLINKSVEKEVKSLSLATAASASSSSTDVSDHLAPAQESSALLETSSDTEMQNLKLKRPHDKNEHEEI